MARGLDHVVHAVHDLDGAADFYRRLGFTVGARNRHPWGTDNHIVQFPGFFLELLTVAEPGKIIEATARQFSFGAYLRDWLREREGLAMLVLESRDAAADREAFARARIGDFELFRFERQGRKPDGAAMKVAFSLAFAADAAADAGFFVYQQHMPENFWNSVLQAHANSVTAVKSAVMVAGNPDRHVAFLSSFTGVEPQQTPDGVRFATPRGAIDVMSAAQYRHQFVVEAPPLSAGARIAALRFAAASMPTAFAQLRAGGVEPIVHGEQLVVDPENGLGAVLCFEPV